MPQEWINALTGGVIIGLAVTIMLLWNGRVTGISGIINGLIFPTSGDTAWRFLFVLGLILGGFTLQFFNPATLSSQLSTDTLATILAGLLVGFGTILGSGCTSGHGVCGISRLSPRSIIATITFISAGMISVYLFKQFGVLQ